MYNDDMLPTSAGEERVEVQALGDGGARRRLIGVTSEESEDVIGSTVAALDDEGKIRRKSSHVGGTGGVLVGVRVGNVVGDLSGALLDITNIVGLVVVLEIFGHGLDLVDSVRNTNERTPGNTGKRMARSTDFAIDLETTAEAAMDCQRLYHRHVVGAVRGLTLGGRRS